jgi:hypothetical protein
LYVSFFYISLPLPAELQKVRNGSKQQILHCFTSRLGQFLCACCIKSCLNAIVSHIMHVPVPLRARISACICVSIYVLHSQH